MGYEGAILKQANGGAQTMQLTPNSNCISTPVGDTANSVKVVFGLYPSGPSCWERTVSAVDRTFELPVPFPCGNVTYQNGLQIQYRDAGGGAYVVLLSGTIVDGQSYSYSPSVEIFDSRY